ncbi:hypothetical protein SDC9_118708 [bioreactor metagenome]|uniref:Uncharacterized protein n=1 Tax=bioreactor metagenome TaxID=1076179 RepID=A0A645C3F3_9ZZZZ
MHHLGRCEVAGKPFQGAGAEGTAHSAPHLGGQAQRHAIAVAHQHAFHAMIIPHREQHLHGAVDL